MRWRAKAVARIAFDHRKEPCAGMAIVLGAQRRMQKNDEILGCIRATLVQLFDLDPAEVTPQARLFEDLEIDSIDVVDLMDQVRHYTGQRVTAEDFRSVRTVADLAGVIERLQRAIA
jgi:acyl carrier protein